jgi:Fe2+ or Zn2+ uptake regulation protein
VTVPLPAPEIAALLARAQAWWSARGSRLTPVRRLVCAAAFASRSTFDAEALLAAVRRQDRGVSSASIYRILADLASADVLITTPGPGGTRLYTPAAEDAASLGHILCSDCGQVFPLDDPCLALRSSPAVRHQGFRPRSLCLRVEADCERHRSTGACPRRPAS